MDTRTNLLKLLEEPAALQKEFEENYVGPGLLKKLKRLLRYRGKYLKYCLLRFRPSLFMRSTRIKTFFGGEIFAITDPYHFPMHMNDRCFTLPGEQETRLTKFLIKNLEENSVFYDIGANFGYYSLLAKEIIKDGEVHSFEPLPDVFIILKENLSKKQSVFLNQLALFNQEGKIDFYDTTVTSAGGSTFNPDVLKNRNLDFLSASKKIKVQTTTLDKYCIEHSKPDFLKIDVEGAESQVIEGGVATLKQNNPIIAMEVWGNSFDNRSHLKAIDTLYNLGYKSYKINDEGELEFLEKIDPARDILGLGAGDNFLFKK
jgi:FkbM family methyltransferase